MTKRLPGANYADLPISEWNVSHFHAWLITETQTRFHVDYTPFGRGSLNSRWLAEKGMLKQAITTYGAGVVHRFIERCLDDYRPSERYPSITFGFMYSYKRDELQRAQLDVMRRKQSEQQRQTTSDDVDLTQFI